MSCLFKSLLILWPAMGADSQRSGDYQRFVDISVYLSGFDSAELLSTGMAQKYFEVVLLNNDPDDVRIFFDAVDGVLALPAREIEREIRRRLMSVDAHRALARNIIILWYTGNWSGLPVSPEAYKHGLMWEAAETHPSGAKQPGYGSWALPPITH